MGAIDPESGFQTLSPDSIPRVANSTDWVGGGIKMINFAVESDLGVAEDPIRIQRHVLINARMILVERSDPFCEVVPSQITEREIGIDG